MASKELVSDPGFTLYCSIMEKLWIKKALQLQHDSIKRSLNKEIPGTEIYDLRQRELISLVALMARLS